MRGTGALAVAVLAIPLGAAARVPRVVHLRFPPFRVAAGTNPEACVALRVPIAGPSFDVARFQIRHRGTGHDLSVQHFLVYAYTGEQLADFPAKSAPIVQSRGCLDLGPADRDRRQLVASSTICASATAVGVRPRTRWTAARKYA